MRDRAEILKEIKDLEKTREALRISNRRVHEKLNVINYTIASLRREGAV